jgi:anti-sigma factor RsiW
MNCPLHTNEGAEILLDYCSRHLDPDRASELQHHVTACTDCRQVVEAQESLWNALDAFEAMPVSLDFDRKLWARIDSEESQSLWNRAWTRVVDGPAIGWSNFLFGWKPVLVAATACAAIAAIMIVSVPNHVQVIDHPTAGDQKMMEHVEKALDDVDMLNQIGLVETHGQGAI